MTPEISARARALPPSPIRKLVPLADQAKSKGRHNHQVCKLDVNAINTAMDSPGVSHEAEA